MKESKTFNDREKKKLYSNEEDAESDDDEESDSDTEGEAENS